ncbi:MAG: 16S rRNA (guanine(527)-N(7))-methyltransferase RsmG [Halofilum sp. (in: g-proteobacteria)]|nr:16S rRNA (guanine(527)-N(7))-methyltransferase RsmG [Halofilum sp. (in: g-proteobacteria)]
MTTVRSAGLAALGLELDARQQGQLLAYRDELARWGRVHNLTSVLDPERMVPVHLLDSLALLPLLRGERIADVGSGGGLPGVPLAIAGPGLQVTLIEPRTKRAVFLAHVARRLGLGNVIVERCRVEELPPGEGFDTLVTRAFGSLADFAAAAGGLARAGGCLLAAKGRDPAAEIADLAEDWRTEVLPLHVPGVEGARHAVRMERVRQEG